MPCRSRLEIAWAEITYGAVSPLDVRPAAFGWITRGRKSAPVLNEGRLSGPAVTAGRERPILCGRGDSAEAFNCGPPLCAFGDVRVWNSCLLGPAAQCHGQAEAVYWALSTAGLDGLNVPPISHHWQRRGSMLPRSSFLEFTGITSSLVVDSVDRSDSAALRPTQLADRAPRMSSPSSEGKPMVTESVNGRPVAYRFSYSPQGGRLTVCLVLRTWCG